MRLRDTSSALILLFAMPLLVCLEDEDSPPLYLPATAPECVVFQPAPEVVRLAADPEIVRFIAFGDWGVEPAGVAAAADAMWSFCSEAGCDFVLGLGDNFYDNGVDGVEDRQWREKFELPFADWDIPFYMTLGNHDYRGNAQAQVEYGSNGGRWVMPARTYAVEAGPVTLVAADTNLPCPQQAQWLAERADTATTPWRVAFGHHPWQSSGHHGSSAGALRRLQEWAFCEHVDLYVAGHDHNLEMLRAECGVALVVSGSPVRSRAVTPGIGSIYASPEAGFAWFEATPDWLRIELRSLDGRLLESQTLLRRDRPVSCAADGRCQPSCAGDPDCATVQCAADAQCEPTCETDPDCFAACPCDLLPAVCEQGEAGGDCACDPYCREPAALSLEPEGGADPDEVAGE